MNLTGGESCHKVYRRSTAIYFYCDRTTQRVSEAPQPLVPSMSVPLCSPIVLICHPVLQPMFLRETSDCSYLFEWRTQYACPPFDVTQCSFK